MDKHGGIKAILRAASYCPVCYNINQEMISKELNTVMGLTTKMLTFQLMAPTLNWVGAIFVYRGLLIMNYTLYGFIALGGALGAMGRYFISTWIYSKGDFVFPWGTFAVNVLGSFILGLVYVWGTEKMIISPNARAFLAVGFIGAFTTFSTFSLETLNIIKDGEIRIVLLNTVGSIVLGLFAVWVGTICAGVISRLDWQFIGGIVINMGSKQGYLENSRTSQEIENLKS